MAKVTSKVFYRLTQKGFCTTQKEKKVKTILKSAMFENNVFIKKFNKDFKVEVYSENSIEVDNCYEKGMLTEINFDGIRMIMRDIETKHHTIGVFHDFPFFKLQFEIEGSSLYTPTDPQEKEVYIPKGHYNLFYIPKVEGTLTYEADSRKTVEILFTEQYLKRLIGNDFKESLTLFGNAIENKQSFKMWPKSKPISSELYKCIHEITNCNYKKSIKKPFLVTKVNELLLVLLAKTDETTQENKQLSVNDYIRILEIENYIKKNLKKPLTINKLATGFGINTSKLKHDFKVVFPTTIFKHITALRMEEAKNMLQYKGFSVSEASYEVGYKNPQHFTVAFKKVYGILPSLLMSNSI